MRKIAALFLLLLCAAPVVAQEEPSFPQRYFWGHIGSGFSTFNGSSGFIGLGFTTVWDKHLLSLQGAGTPSMDIFCPSSDPLLNHYSLQYGRVFTQKGLFLYVKGGPALVEYRFVSDTIVPTTLGGCNEYRFDNSFHPGFSMEVGSLHTFGWFMLQAYISGLVAPSPGAVFEVGMRIGFGDFY